MVLGSGGQGPIIEVTDKKTGKKEMAEYEEGVKAGVVPEARPDYPLTPGDDLPSNEKKIKQKDGSFKIEQVPTELFTASKDATKGVGNLNGRRFTTNWDDADVNNKITAQLDKKTGEINITAPKYVTDRDSWKDYVKQYEQMSDDYVKNPKGFYTDKDGNKISIEDMVQKTTDALNNDKLKDKDGNEIKGAQSYVQSAKQFEGAKQSLISALGGTQDDGNGKKTPLNLTDTQVNTYLTQAISYKDSDGTMHNPAKTDKQTISEEVIDQVLGKDAIKQMESYDEGTHTATVDDIQKYINTKKDDKYGSDNANEDIQRMYSNALSIAKNDNLSADERVKALSFSDYLASTHPDVEWYQAIGDALYGYGMGGCRSAYKFVTDTVDTAIVASANMDKKFTDADIEEAKAEAHKLDDFMDEKFNLEGISRSSSFAIGVGGGYFVAELLKSMAVGVAARNFATAGKAALGGLAKLIAAGAGGLEGALTATTGIGEAAQEVRAGAEAAEEAGAAAKAAETGAKAAAGAGKAAEAAAETAEAAEAVSKGVAFANAAKGFVGRIAAALGPEKVAKLCHNIVKGQQAIEAGLNAANSGAKIGKSIAAAVDAGEIAKGASTIAEMAGVASKGLDLAFDLVTQTFADNQRLTHDLLMADRKGDNSGAVKEFTDDVMAEIAWGGVGIGGSFVVGKMKSAFAKTSLGQALSFNMSRLGAKIAQPFSDMATRFRNLFSGGKFSAKAEETAATIDRLAKKGKKKMVQNVEEKASLREMKRAQAEGDRIKYMAADETGDTLRERVKSAYDKQAETYEKYQNALDDLFLGNKRSAAKFKDVNQEFNYGKEMDTAYETAQDVMKAERDAGGVFNVLKRDASKELDISRLGKSKSNYIMSTLTTDYIAINSQYKKLKNTANLTEGQSKSLADMEKIIDEFNSKATPELKEAVEEHIKALDNLGTASQNTWAGLGIVNKEELESMRKTGGFDDGWFHVQGRWSESGESAGNGNFRRQEGATHKEVTSVFSGGGVEQDSYKGYREGMHYENPLVSFVQQEQRMANIYNRKKLFEAFDGAVGGSSVVIGPEGTDYVRKMNTKWEGKTLKTHLKDTASEALSNASESLKTKFDNMMTSNYNSTKTALDYANKQRKADTAKDLLENAKNATPKAPKRYDNAAKNAYIEHLYTLDDINAANKAAGSTLKAKNYADYKNINKAYEKLTKEHPELLEMKQSERGAAVKTYINKNMRTKNNRITRSKKAWESAQRDPDFRKAVLHDHANLITPDKGMRDYTARMRQQMEINSKTAYYEQALEDAEKARRVMYDTGKVSDKQFKDSIDNFVEDTMNVMRNDSGFKHTVDAVASEFGIEDTDTLADYLAQDYLLNGTSKEGGKSFSGIIDDGLETQLNDLKANRTQYYNKKASDYRKTCEEAGKKVSQKEIDKINDLKNQELEHIDGASDTWKEHTKRTIMANVEGSHQQLTDVYEQIAPDIVDHEGIFKKMDEIRKEITKDKTNYQDIIMVPDEMGRERYIKVNPILAEMINVRTVARDPSTFQKLVQFTNSLWRIGTSGPLAFRSQVNQMFKDGMNAYVGGGAVMTAKSYADSLAPAFGEEIADYIKKYEPKHFENIRNEAIDSIGWLGGSPTIVERKYLNKYLSDVDNKGLKELLKNGTDNLDELAEKNESIKNVVNRILEDYGGKVRPEDVLGLAPKEKTIRPQASNLLNRAELAGGSESYIRVGEDTYANYLNNADRSINNDTESILDRANQKISQFVKKTDVVNDFREQTLRRATYASAYEDALSKGMSVKNAREHAEFIMSNATTNFTRASGFAEAFQTATPYLNAAVNGNRSYLRLASMDPVGVFTRQMNILGPLARITLHALANKQNREEWKNMNDYDKEGNIVLFSDSGDVVTIPVPDELAPMFSFVQNGIADMYDANRKSFWDLEFNSLLNAAPVDLSGFTQDDAQSLLSDKEWYNRINIKAGVSKVAYNLLPAGGKTAVRAITGIDPYTGKPLDSSYVTYDPETGEFVEAGSYASEYAKNLASLFGKNSKGESNVSAAMVESIVEGIIGTGTAETFDALYKLGKGVVTGDAEMALSSGGGLLDYATSSLTVTPRSQADTAWNKAVSQLYEEKDDLIMSDAYQSAVQGLYNATTPESRQKAYNKLADVVDGYYDHVISTARNLAEQYPANFTGKKYAAVISLCNFGKVATVAPTNDQYFAYMKEMQQDAQNQGRRQAIESLVEMGFSGAPNDLSMFGQVRYNSQTGETYTTYTTPMAILEQEYMTNDYKNQDIHQANIDSILKNSLPDGYSSIYSYRKDFYDKLLKSGMSKKKARAEWNAHVMETLQPYIDKYGVDNVLTYDTSDYLDNVMYVGVYSAQKQIKKVYDKEEKKK